MHAEIKVMARRVSTAVLFLFPIVAVSGCVSLEDSLLFHPAKTSPAEYQAPPPPLQDLELHATDGTKIGARWCPHSQGQGAILYCPGNGGNLEGRTTFVRELGQRLGESVLIFDYPGYGRSEGVPSEAGCYAAADAAYLWLVESQNIAPERIILYGESLGGAMAVELASRRPHRALVLVRTFASLSGVAQAHFSLAAGLLATKRFDNESRLAQCQRPVLIAQADHDRVIPFEQGERLRSACAARRIEFDRLCDLDHNDPLPERFYTYLRRFLQSAAPVAEP